MIQINNNLNDDPWDLYYNEEKIGTVLNELAMLDVCVQIRKECCEQSALFTPYTFRQYNKKVRVTNMGKAVERTGKEFFTTSTNLNRKILGFQ